MNTSMNHVIPLKNRLKSGLLKTSKKTFHNGLLTLSSIIGVMTLAAVPVTAQEAKAKTTLAVGDKVEFSALSKAVWIKNDGPKNFEPGKVYIIECWATWCAPCIAAIPHVNGLHKKYYDKGLRVLGMCVWDGDQAKTKNFVIKKGDGMAYPVAFTGEESAFSKEWLDAAGVESIPHAFVVRNGILLGSTQVSRLTTSLIESLLAGDAGAQKASDVMSSAQNNQGKTDALVRAIGDAGRKGDADMMTKKIKELKAIDPNHPELPVLELRILVARRDWPAATISLKKLPNSEAKSSYLSRTGRDVLGKKHPYSDDFKKALVSLYTDYVLHNSPVKGPNHYGMLSNIQWNMGDKEKALITANKSIEAAKSIDRTPEAYTIAYTRFAKTVKEGRMVDTAERSKWVREAIAKLKEKK